MNSIKGQIQNRSLWIFVIMGGIGLSILCGIWRIQH
ncbi:MAG: hypothetical protein ACI8UX_001378, partial [Psychromonas sp.]